VAVLRNHSVVSLRNQAVLQGSILMLTANTTMCGYEHT
jgi:hypothetical protein